MNEYNKLDVILSGGKFICSRKITFQVRIFITHVLVMWYYKRTKKSMTNKINHLNSENYIKVMQIEHIFLLTSIKCSFLSP